nr:54s ribosomal protein l23, mitochondrial [Quercus suber]
MHNATFLLPVRSLWHTLRLADFEGLAIPGWSRAMYSCSDTSRPLLALLSCSRVNLRRPPHLHSRNYTLTIGNRVRLPRSDSLHIRWQHRQQQQSRPSGPSFTINLRRSAKLSPKYALFEVPLWFSKLDLRDYLYHGYNVRTHSIRSYVKQQRVSQGDPTREGGKPQPRRWYRPKALKFMTVELDKPFVWPERPTDLTEWNKEEFVAGQEAQEDQNSRMGPESDRYVDEGRKAAMREQAKALLEGREKWKPGFGSRGFGPVQS